jgi:regulation of enolase protein 1 (concanavalin A-like superfamily)
MVRHWALAKDFGATERDRTMRFGSSIALGWVVVGALSLEAAAPLFRDDFKQALGPGWKILREQKDAWRVTADGLEVRVLPGNMWGGSNDAKNTFVRSVPDPAQGPLEVSVQVENRPTEQYEQVDLVWYYNDGYQVKIGQELVDGKLSIVMGREEADRTRTIAIIPLDSFVVDVRFRVEGNQIRGAYRTPSMTEWKEAGGCDLPVKGAPNVSLQVYQGTTRVERWAKIRAFEVRAL